MNRRLFIGTLAGAGVAGAVHRKVTRLLGCECVRCGRFNYVDLRGFDKNGYSRNGPSCSSCGGGHFIVAGSLSVDDSATEIREDRKRCERQYGIYA